MLLIYVIVRGNKNEFIDQTKELYPDYYDSHMYDCFCLFVLALTIYCKCVCAK